MKKYNNSPEAPASAPAAPHAPADGLIRHGDVPSIEITLRQARELVHCFGGSDAEISIIERPATWAEMPEGLYAYFSEYPDEGSMYLGPTEIDESLADDGVAPAAPHAQAEPVARMTNEEIDIIWQTMPGGPGAWLKGFGYQNFAKAIEDEVILNHQRIALVPQEAEQAAPAAVMGDLVRFDIVHVGFGRMVIAEKGEFVQFDSVKRFLAQPAAPAVTDAEQATPSSALFEIGELVEINDAFGDMPDTVFVEWNAKRYEQPPDTKIYVIANAKGAPEAEQASVLAARAAADELAGWNAAAKALSERAAGHYRNKDFELQDECLQCASMLHDLKPAAPATTKG